MRTLLCVAALSFLSFVISYSNGVGVLDGRTGVYLRLDSTTVNVTVESQIAVTTTTQYFKNLLATDTVKYAFPLPEQASAIGLRWRINGIWRIANITGSPQDTTLPGGGTIHPNLKTYLGNTALFFGIPQMIQADSTLAVELTYVELLPYKFGNVNYTYPSDYRLIQTLAIGRQTLNFSLTSPRTIDSIRVVSSHPVSSLINNGSSASVRIQLNELPGTANYQIRYTLSLTQLGLFSFSTFQPDSLVPDTLGRGFFTFVAEPDPTSTSGTIKKVFTLIIDRSGSMYGTKIVQARDAARFITQNLNTGDKFNIIDFDDIITPFRTTHVPYTTQARDSAIAYINTLTARGLTNISGAFDVAVPQFAAANDSTANIIIFFTDGMPTTGITTTNLLIAHVDTLMQRTERNIFLFVFGIGTDVNQQLLTQMASHNKGIAEFLLNDELYSRITDFYQTIRNPVLLNTQISFNPPLVSETYPLPLPNLYKGQQMIVAGRYRQAGNTIITLSGKAFSQPVSYQYNVALAESSPSQYQFLPKIWAKRKIEYLLVQYYALNPSSPEALALKAKIVGISRAYGVISPFTSFTGGGGTGVEVHDRNQKSVPAAFELLGNYPNPFNPSTTIRVKLISEYNGVVELRIYNTLGELVRTLKFVAHGVGTYNIEWDGHLSNGSAAASGVYVYVVSIENTVLAAKMMLVK
ncbi:MAG: VWA domain-containing protein [Ignavibacteriae bacterium]|nr:VWA domain-containing protein [Ignavibacteriota bacterium]